MLHDRRLEAGTAGTAAQPASTQALQSAMFEEMKGRIARAVAAKVVLHI